MKHSSDNAKFAAAAAVVAMLTTAMLATAMLAGGAAPVLAQEVGRFSSEWSTSVIEVEAVADPKVSGVTCHVSNFDRSGIDRWSTGAWFSDPSNASIACRQTARAVTISDIDTTARGEEVFPDGQGQVFKSAAIRRIYDKANNSLIYVVYSRQSGEAAARTSISTVPLFAAEVTWRNGKP